MRASTAVQQEKPNMHVIVLDPGHGGKTDLLGSSANNAVGPGGMLEKVLTLDVAKRAAVRLAELGHDVRLTRPPDADVNVSAADRAAVARESGAAAFVSIHFNAFEDPSVQGTEVLVRPVGGAGLDAVDPGSRALAQSVLGATVAATGHTDRGLKPGRWAVLAEQLHAASTARCVVEVSFLTDPTEESRLGDPEYLQSIANGVAAGIHQALNAGAAAQHHSRPVRAMASGMARTSSFARVAGRRDPDAYGSMQGMQAPGPDLDGEGAEFDPGASTLALGRCEPDPEPHTDSHCEENPRETAGTENFALHEFRCNDGTDCPVRFRGHLQQLMENLEVLRAELGEPIDINSGYRTPDYNWRVACGVSRSKHMCGMAADFRCDSHTPQQIYEIVESLIEEGRMRPGGLHAYNSFVHYDVRGANARW